MRYYMSMSVYQFPLQLLTRNSLHSINISSGLKNIFVHPRREIFPFQVIFRAVCGMCMYQFPLQLLINNCYHSENILVAQKYFCAT